VLQQVGRFSSLYIGILAATSQTQWTSSSALCFSSLYIGILAATQCQWAEWRDRLAVSVPFTSGSSLQRRPRLNKSLPLLVSVPFTSGSSLQRQHRELGRLVQESFSSLYIGILAATLGVEKDSGDKECFSSLYIGILAATPRWIKSTAPTSASVSVPFTSGSSLQQNIQSFDEVHQLRFSSLYIGILAATPGVVAV